MLSTAFRTTLVLTFTTESSSTLCLLTNLIHSMRPSQTLPLSPQHMLLTSILAQDFPLKPSTLCAIKTSLACCHPKTSEVWAEAFERRLADSELRARLREVGLDRFLNLAGCFLADADSLKRFAGDAPLSTDDRPVVLFAAPRFAVRRDIQPHELLLTLLERCLVGAKEVAAADIAAGDATLADSVVNFIAARDVYLKGLVEEGAGNLPLAIDSSLESARRSLQFTPGYARCVTIIQVIARTDREQARKLFHRLEEAQPSQPLGKKLLGPLFEENAPR